MTSRTPPPPAWHWALPALEAVLAELPRSALVVDRRGTILLTNAAGKRLLAEDGDGVRADIARALAAEESSFTLQAADGGEVLVAVRRERADDPRPRAERWGERWSLSPREKEVLALLAGGRSNASIANELGISVRTVETYVARLLERAEVENRAELTATFWSG